MKILFYDGSLIDVVRKDRPECLKPGRFTVVDAARGPTANHAKLSDLVTEKFSDNVLTNSLVSLSHVFGWNDEENHTDIYLWQDQYKDFIRCDRLTLKEIRKEHNIAKMYMANSFDEEVTGRE